MNKRGNMGNLESASANMIVSAATGSVNDHLSSNNMESDMDDDGKTPSHRGNVDYIQEQHHVARNKLRSMDRFGIGYHNHNHAARQKQTLEANDTIENAEEMLEAQHRHRMREQEEFQVSISPSSIFRKKEKKKVN